MTEIIDERPISPMKKVVKTRFDNSAKTKSAENTAWKISSHSAILESNYDSWRNEGEQKQETIQTLHKRDLMIAIKRREKLESVKGKDNNTSQPPSSNNYKNVKSKVNSVWKRSQNNKSSLSNYWRNSPSPRSSTLSTKKSMNESQKSSKNNTMSKSNNFEYSNKISNNKNNDHGKVEKLENGRMYYRQEDLMNFQYESVTSKEKINIETKKNEFLNADKQKTLKPNCIISSSPVRLQNFESEISINTADNACPKYVASLDKNQIYPYKS